MCLGVNEKFSQVATGESAETYCIKPPLDQNSTEPYFELPSLLAARFLCVSALSLIIIALISSAVFATAIIGASANTAKAISADLAILQMGKYTYVLRIDMFPH
jgi:hypothetical protein